MTIPLEDTFTDIIGKAIRGQKLDDQAVAQLVALQRAPKDPPHATDPMPVDPAKLPGDCAVFDILAARQTELMQAATARGLKVVGGVEMIKHQLPLQTAFWRGEGSELLHSRK